MTFIHLHGHSHYSLLEAFGEPKAIIARAKELGMPSIALTDYNWMYGAIEFYQAAKKAEIKALFGVELWFVQDILRKDKNENAGNIVLLAKDNSGYQNLMGLTTKAHIVWYHQKARIDIPTLQGYTQWLVAIIWWPQSWLGKLIIQQESQSKIYELIQRLQETLGQENVYAEIICQDEELLAELKQVNQRLRSHAAELWMTLVCTSDFHYPRPDDKELYEILLCIKEGKRYSDRDVQATRWDRSIHSEEEITQILGKNWYTAEEITGYIAATADLANQLNVKLELWNMLFPKYTSPPEIETLYATYKARNT